MTKFNIKALENGYLEVTLDNIDEVYNLVKPSEWQGNFNSNNYKDYVYFLKGHRDRNLYMYIDKDFELKGLLKYTTNKISFKILKEMKCF
jgi:hypothetical protein